MKQLPKRDGIPRYRIHRGGSTVETVRGAIFQGIDNLLADIGESENCLLQIVPGPRTGKPRLAIARRKSPSAGPLLAPPGKR